MPTDQPPESELRPSEKPLLRANPLMPPEYGEGHRPLPNLAAIIAADNDKYKTRTSEHISEVTK